MPKTTGEALKYFRNQTKFTQKEVVDKLGKSQQWLSDAENDKCSLLWIDIKSLCNLYGITPSDLEQKESE